MPGVVRTRHHPASALLEKPDPDLAAELVVDVATDPERQVDLLRLEPGDLLAQELERGVVVGAGHPEQLVVALVAAEDGVGQVEEDDRRLGEVGEALVLEPAARHQVAGRGRVHDVVGVDGALGRQVVDDRLVGERLVADAGPAIPRRALPEALGGLVGVGLRGIEPVVVGGPGGHERGGRPVGQDVAPVERLGRRPHRLRPEPERLALVRGQPAGRAVAGEDGQDRHGLAELAQAGDEAAARECDVVRMRRDEDMGHGRASIPSVSGRSGPGQPHGCNPPAPMSGTKTQAPSVRSSHSSPWRVDDGQHWRSRGPTGITSRPPSASCSRSSIGIGRRSGGDDDPVPRRAGRVAEAAVGLADRDVPVEVERAEPFARGLDEGRLALERGDVRAEPGQDRRLVAGARADLEDPVARPDPRGPRSSGRP